MTEKELDAFMSKVLLDAIAFDEDRLEEKIPYAASARHRRQMRTMLKDPVRWTRERGKPVWKRVLQTAAVILLMLSLGLGSVMLACPTARATIVRWVTEWYETHRMPRGRCRGMSWGSYQKVLWKIWKVNL